MLAFCGKYKGNIVMHAISVSKETNFTEWYQEVIDKAGLSELSEVRGCMVIKPYGYAIWERMQSILDEKFKELGHSNAYFPLFIPLNLFENEAEHVEGFAKEMAVVTHHRIERQNGKLVPAGELEIPLIVRPTSEMIIGKSFSRWIKSYRDLPLKINQWANVVRWEMRPRMFLRTAEFLWQEDHIANATAEDAIKETEIMHDVYKWFVNDVLCISTISGKKPEFDKFAGAINTYTLEGYMPNGKALQMCTNHYLGQNFAKATNIKFQDKNGEMQYAHTSSHGLTTRVIGGLIMVHGDNDGLRLPSSIVPYEVVIVPVIKDDNVKSFVLEYCNKIASCLKNNNTRVYLDLTDDTSQNKKWNYVRKGVPIICELGKREAEENKISFIIRAKFDNKYIHMDVSEFLSKIQQLLKESDEILKEQSKFDDKITDLNTLAELQEYFRQGYNGFVRAKWSGSTDNLEELDKLNMSIRCIPDIQSKTINKCILTGKEASLDVIIAKSY